VYWRAPGRGGNHGWAATKYAVLHTQEILKQLFFTAIQQLFGRLDIPTHPSFRPPIAGSPRSPIQELDSCHANAGIIWPEFRSATVQEEVGKAHTFNAGYRLRSIVFPQCPTLTASNRAADAPLHQRCTTDAVAGGYLAYWHSDQR